MIRILQFVESLDIGGIETFVMNVFRNLDHSKYEMIFLVLKEQKYDFVSELESCKAKIYYLIPEKHPNYQSQLKKGMYYYRLMNKWLIAHKNEFDIVHVEASYLQNMFVFIKAFKKAGVDKIVLHSHSSMIESKKSCYIHKVFRFFLPSLHVEQIACSDVAGKWMFGNHSYHVIHNGIPLKAFEYDKKIRMRVRQELGLSDNCIALFHAGRFEHVKNQKYLLHVLQEYKKIQMNIKLIFAGDGSDLEEIKRLARKMYLENDIIFLGKRSDIAILLSAMDCFLFPSHFEGLSVVAVEVQANNLPIIVSDHVSKQTCLCSNFMMLPIDENEDTYRLWAKKIDVAITKGRSTNKYKRSFYEYDIFSVTEKLGKIYHELMIK